MTVGDASAPVSTSSEVAAAVSLNPVLMKTSQEILTSLHLIRDIRRLEKYQRDFFLKVKESLTQVQALLDQQLMDVAWSDHLTDCEDNLLKMSTHLKSTSPARLAELYAILLHDRDRLATRFQELSVKSSLSEFVVNSGSLLDLHTVRIAAEAILKNEKPLPVRTDPSIPVDHTFFLANFCTASLASSMMASVVPKTAMQASPAYCHARVAAASSAAVSVAVSVGGRRSPIAQGRMNGALSNGLDVDRRLGGAARTMTVANCSGGGGGNSANNGGHVDFDVDKTKEHTGGDVGGTGLVYGAGDELVSAISQITARGQAGCDDPMKMATKKSVLRSSDPWGRDLEAIGVSSSNVGNVGNVASDVSDTVSSASEDASGGVVAVADVNKPLSFARIASLHLGDKRCATVLPKLVTVEDMTPSTYAPSQTLLLPPSLNPRYYLDIVMEGKKLGRVVVEVQPQVAPKMSQNFHALVTSERGYGYKGCQFFQAWKNESVICGDWEHNSGRGGRAALDEGPLFTPDDTKLPCVRGAVGMRRMSKKHSSLNQVASQFRIILANMNTQFTGIFGHVVAGLDALDKVANVGGEGGRPEKMAVVAQCGIYKQ